MDIIKINDQELQVKTWQGQRVVTFKDIDQVHKRTDGTAKRNFNKNQQHFIEGIDYFQISKIELGTKFVPSYGFGKNAATGTLITETGYLMIVKSFTDDLAWQIQRDLVNTYFKFKEVVQDFNTNYPIDLQNLNCFLQDVKNNLPCLFAQVNNIEEQSCVQLEKLESVIDNMTLSTRQQQKIAETARKRVNFLLGGAHSATYKKLARGYMINLWNGLKETFCCSSSYKDLNPKHYNEAIEFIERWCYVER